jgi:integrase/recombinase XerD
MDVGVCRVGTRARIRVQGPLAQFADGWRRELMRRGYSRNAMAGQVRLMECLSRYLDRRRSRVAEGLSPLIVDGFLRVRRAEGCRDFLSHKGLSPLLGYLADVNAMPDRSPQVAGTAAEVVLEQYRDYLVQQRGLALASVRAYRATAEVFLRELPEPFGSALEDLDAGQVMAFVLRTARGCGVNSTKSTVTALRSLLRFLHVEGRVSAPLDQAVPSAAGWKLSSLPRALGGGHVQRMLSGCDRSTAAGRRDYLVLMLLARLGLRACEVAAFELDDIDWRIGELLIRGKGNRVDRLPIPPDVGESIAAYVLDGRPRCETRSLIVRVHAPRTGVSPGQVRNIVRLAGQRAGLGVVGAHRLRHTLASELLRRGAPLVEIGQLLRHRAPLTTAIYAKIDQDALRTLARPWPGSAA